MCWLGAIFGVLYSKAIRSLGGDLKGGIFIYGTAWGTMLFITNTLFLALSFLPSSPEELSRYYLSSWLYGMFNSLFLD